MFIGKTANQLYKESGTTLSFKEWISRQKEKMLSADGTTQDVLIINKPLNDTIQTALSKMHAEGGYKTTTSGNFLGIKPAYLWAGAGVLLTTTIIFLTIKKAKKK